MHRGLLRSFVFIGIVSLWSPWIAGAQEEAPVNFEAEVQPIFSNFCALSGCHAGNAPFAELSLEPGRAYDNIVGVESRSTLGFTRVIPGDPDESLLVRKAEGQEGVGFPMPPNGMLIAPQMLETIRRWIEQGALREPAPTAVAPATWAAVKKNKAAKSD